MAQVWTKHPVYPIPAGDELAAMKDRLSPEPGFSSYLQYYWHCREEKIKAAISDPFYHGYEPDHWKTADEMLSKRDHVFAFGGNRAGKSEWAAKRTVQFMMENPGARVVCCHSSAESSLKVQQPLLWKFIPQSEKELRRKECAYTQKSGFTGLIPTFILSNGAQCFFNNWTQDRDKLQGDAYDWVWMDELVPLDWFREMTIRVLSRDGKMITTFTPIEGFTATVKYAMRGWKCKKWERAELLPANQSHVPGAPRGKMPRMAESQAGGIVWFWTQDNPWGNYRRMKKEMAKANSDWIKIRAYGWANDMNASAFPRFSDIHILPAEKIPEKGTNYLSADPAPTRNWFLLWCRVDKLGRKYIYREWPDYDTYGEWAVEGPMIDGKMGPAQDVNAGEGDANYRQMIRRIEGDEVMMERYIDPRAAAAAAAAEEHGSTALIDRLAEGEHGMVFVPAPGVRIEEGVAAINNLFSFDRDKPIDAYNEPKLYVSENCKNLIACLQMWTGKDKEKGASKDPIDALRYLVLMDPQYVEGGPMVTGGAEYYGRF